MKRPWLNKDAAILIVVCCIFGLFWGTSYINFSTATFFLQEYSVVLETLSRGVFCIGLAFLFKNVKKIPSLCFVGIVLIQFCIIGARLTGAQNESAVVSVAISLLYSLTMAFFIICLARLLYTYPLRSLYWAVPTGYGIAYIFSMVVEQLSLPVIFAHISGLAVALSLFLCMCYKGQVALRGSERINTDLPSPSSLKKLVGAHFEAQGQQNSSVLFVGSMALFLVLIGTWLQVGAQFQASIWLHSPIVSVCNIAVLAFMMGYLFLSKGALPFRKLSVISLLAFLVALLLSAFFWEGAPVIVEIFAGVWLSVFQVLLFVFCGTVARGQGLHGAFLCSVLLGSMLVLLGIGNGIERLLFWGKPLDQTVFLMLSLGLALVLVLFNVMEFLPFLKKISQEREDGEAEEKDRYAATVDKLSRFYGISPRERVVLESYARGRSTVHIAQQLVLSEYTVRTYLKRVYGKLGVHNKQELIDLIEQEQDK